MREGIEGLLQGTLYSEHSVSELDGSRLFFGPPLQLAQHPGHSLQPYRVWHQPLWVKCHVLYLAELILSQIISDRVNILPSPASESPQKVHILWAGCSLSLVSLASLPTSVPRM